MIHELKIKQCYLYHIIEEKKTFEVRKNDRDFQVGDHIRFLPLESENYNVYNMLEGTIPLYNIDYIHSGLGMKKGYVVLSITPTK